MKKLAVPISILIVTCALAQNPAPAPLPSLTLPAAPRIESLDEANSVIQRWWSRLRDWPQLTRYRDANAQLAAPKPGEQRVVFMGDSITDGWKLADYFPGKPYVNRGIGGQTTPQMLVRMMPDVVELHPRVVLILAGTNDLAGNTGPQGKEDIERNYQAMAELARAHKISVVFASVLPIHDQGRAPQCSTTPACCAPNSPPTACIRTPTATRSWRRWPKRRSRRR